MRSAAVVPAALVLALAATPSSSQPAWFHDDAVRIELPAGALEVRVDPEGSPALPFEAAGPGRWLYDGPTGELVGRRYAIELRNRTDERLKVVVAVDGVNVYFQEPLRGRADADVGSVVRPRETRRLEGFQVDRHTAQRFVFAPPEWSEGSEVAATSVGTIEVHVYREWGPSIRPRDRERDVEPRHGGPPGSRPAEPPIGTAAGEDFDSDVRPVRFDARTTTPEARALLDYGRPSWGPGPGSGTRLGVRGEEISGGVRIVEVFGGSPAEEVGLFVGDVLTRADSVRRPSLRELRRILDGKRPGEYLFLELERGPHRLTIQMRLVGGW